MIEAEETPDGLAWRVRNVLGGVRIDLTATELRAQRGQRVRSVRREDVVGLEVFGGGLHARTSTDWVFLTGLALGLDDARLAVLIRDALGLDVPPPAGEPPPPGWRLATGSGGPDVLLPDLRRRRRIARWLLMAALALAALFGLYASADGLERYVQAIGYAAGLVALPAAWFGFGWREFVLVGDGLLAVQLRLRGFRKGWPVYRTRELVLGTITHKGKVTYQLAAQCRGWRPAQVLLLGSDPTRPYQLGSWLAARTGVTLKDIRGEG